MEYHPAQYARGTTLKIGRPIVEPASSGFNNSIQMDPCMHGFSFDFELELQKYICV
jgi:hypothetical protein